MNSENALYKFSEALDSALFNTIQDSTARYEAVTKITDALETVIDAVLGEARLTRGSAPE